MICSPVMSKEPLEQNAILRDLKSEDRVRVLADGSIRRFELREIVYEAQQHIEDAYFPLGCVLSFVTLMQDGAMIEIGTIRSRRHDRAPLPRRVDSLSCRNLPCFAATGSVRLGYVASALRAGGSCSTRSPIASPPARRAS